MLVTDVVDAVYTNFIKLNLYLLLQQQYIFSGQSFGDTDRLEHIFCERDVNLNREKRLRA